MQNLSGPIDLIQKSFSVFFEKRNLIYFVKIYAILLPFTIVGLIQDYYINSQTKNIADPLQVISKLGWIILPIVVISLAQLIISFWVSAAAILSVEKVLAGGDLSVKEVFSSSWNLLFKFSILDIVVGLIVGVGFVLLIIPGVLFFVWFYFAGFELITKGTGVLESMGNSKRLVQGKFWKVFGRVFAIALFSTLAAYIFSLIPFSLGGIPNTLTGALFILPSYLLYRELSVQ